MDEIKLLKAELEKIRSQFYIFYELTQAMRTSLRLDEVAYIILTGLTARQGLGFNRALMFLIDSSTQRINGFMGTGPIDGQEAHKIWKLIEGQHMDLYALIENYRRNKERGVQQKFLEFTRTISLPLDPSSGIAYESLHEIAPLHIKKPQSKELHNDPLIKKLDLKEFVIAPLRSKSNPLGLIVVDNSITHKPITEETIRILSMFINQAAGAIENSQMYESTLQLAHTDGLTTLWNYGYFQYKLDEEILTSQSEKHSVAIILLDMDNFKKFNDSFGHPAGDFALKKIAEILKKCSRKNDIVCRYGGEEFTLILPMTSKEEAFTIAERIRSTVEQTEIMNKNLTVSLGIACFPHDANTKEELIQKADLALYRAKSENKNRVILA